MRRVLIFSHTFIEENYYSTIIWIPHRTKKEYLKRKFSDATHEAKVQVRIDALVIPKKESFMYLGSISMEMGRWTIVLYTDWREADKLEACFWGTV